MTSTADRLQDSINGPWARDRDAARDAWRVTADQWHEHTRYVEAEADTGSRVAVTISKLPPVGNAREGGPWLVTVTAPWQNAYALQPYSMLALSYVAEHLGRPGCKPHEHHAGDLVAVAMTVGHALNRRVYLSA